MRSKPHPHCADMVLSTCVHLRTDAELKMSSERSACELGQVKVERDNLKSELAHIREKMETKVCYEGRGVL